LNRVGKRVLLVTADLMFRSKLAGLVAAAGGEVTRDEARCDLAVVELGGPSGDRLAELVGRNVPVLAFGSHVRPDALRAAREAGATAVPNSQVEARLRELLNG
jgi:hypothetical protein